MSHRRMTNTSSLKIAAAYCLLCAQQVSLQEPDFVECVPQVAIGLLMNREVGNT
jgi:hypothetical protein